MRMIRLRRKKERPRFREELRIVPRWLKILCLVLYLLALGVAVTIVNIAPDTRFPEFRDNAAAATLAIIGLVIYLLVREPLPYPCPRCGALVGPRFNFCSSCKCNLHPSCPNCKQEIAETDKFCPNCAHELKPAELPDALTKPISQE